MLARLNIPLPFSVQIPDGERFDVYTYSQDGCKISVYPPVRSDIPATAGTGVESVTINERPAFSANALRIDFHKDEFNRDTGIDCDPPYEFMEGVVNSFLQRLRCVTRAFRVQPISLMARPWRLAYLNDDESELEKTPGKVRGRVALAFSLEVIGLTKEVWHDIHDLEPDYEAPTWDTLLLDAYSMLPTVGPTIVLTAAALEVFIGTLLDDLAGSGKVPGDLWTWINSREWLRAPSTDEQFDALSKILIGYSLKSDQGLWKAFKNIRTARNSFVHQGVAVIGGKRVSEADARKLLTGASQILTRFREQLPEELRWRTFKHEMDITAIWPIFGEDTENSNDGPNSLAARGEGD